MADYCTPWSTKSLAARAREPSTNEMKKNNFVFSGFRGESFSWRAFHLERLSNADRRSKSGRQRLWPRHGFHTLDDKAPRHDRDQQDRAGHHEGARETAGGIHDEARDEWRNDARDLTGDV